MKTESRTAAVAEGLALMVLATIIWGIVPICAKVLLRIFDPYSIALSRFVLALAVLWPIMRMRRARRLDRTDKLWMLLGGVGMAGNYSLFNLGLQHTTASAANLVVQIEMAELVFLTWLLLKERLGWQKLLGVAVIMGGIAVVFSGKGGLGALSRAEYLFGNTILLFAGSSWALYILGQKTLVNRGMPVAQALVGMFSVATVLTLLPVSVFHQARGPITPLAMLCLVIIGVFSTGVAYLLAGRAFRLLDASTVGATASLVPIVTIINARIFLHEQITVYLVIGALLVIAGILTIATQDSQTPSHTNA